MTDQQPLYEFRVVFKSGLEQITPADPDIVFRAQADMCALYIKANMPDVESVTAQTVQQQSA